MHNIIRKRRLKWLGYAWRMNKDRRANQILHWVPERRKRSGRPRKNRLETVMNDLKVEPCADVIVSAAVRRSISVGGGAPPVQEYQRRRRGAGWAAKPIFL